MTRTRTTSTTRCYWTAIWALAPACLSLACLLPSQKPPTGPQTPVGFPDVWAAAPSADIDSTKNGSQSASPYFEPESRTIRAAGAVGDAVGFQVVLEGGRNGANNFNIGAEPFTSGGGTIPRESIRLYRQYPLRVERFPNWYFRSVGQRKPRDVPDVLVPLDAPQHGQPISIAPGESVTLWCSVNVPAGAQPGDYAGAIVIQAADGATRRLPVALNIRDLGIANTPGMPVIARVQILPLIKSATSIDAENTRQIFGSPEAKKAIYDAFKLLHAHGLSPMTSDIKPPFRQEIDGRVTIDWSGYDALFGPLIDGSAYSGAPAAAWPLPIDETYPDPAAYGGRASATYNAILKEYMTACIEHFEQRGWKQQAFVYFDIPKSENPTKEEGEQVRQLATLTHLVREDLAFATRLAPQSMEQFGWPEQSHVELKSLVDIWATPARYENPTTLERLQTLGKRTWFNPDRPPFSGSLAVEAPLVQARSVPAQAFLMKHGAIVINHTTDWPKDVVAAPIDEDDQPSDTWLIYPGKPFGLSEPVPSMRLMELQQGLGDFRRMQQLDKRGRGETARLVSRSLIKAAGTETYGDNYQDAFADRRVDDPEAWDLARRILDDELDAVMHGVEPEEVASGAGRGKWTRFFEEAGRKIEGWFEGARLELRTRGEKSQYVLTYDIAVRNDLTEPLKGDVNFGQMPPEARRVSDTVTIGPVDPFKMGRGSIIMATPVLPDTTIDGHIPQEVIFDANTSGAITIAAAASVAQVVTLNERPTIDGKLEDWPPASVNAAADFRLITGGLAPGRDRKSPKSQTVVYFGRYDDTLYVALAAEAPPSEGKPKSTLRNFVEYRDLIPVGEDLIEIMIDPTNRGVLPGDLYHLVVKSSGNPKFERGISMTPPIGEVKPWTGAQPECTVRHTPDGWAAELAIPIAAFGEDAAQNRIWGVNVARLEPVRGEYSDWARAPRYCYDPRTLGNLVWPE